MQHELDYISNWCESNHMKLNPKKYKELRVNFQRALPDLAQLTVDGTPLETISSYKLLGLQIQNDLKGNRQRLCLKLFNKLKTLPSSKLSHLVPCTRYESHGRLVRGGNNLSLCKCRTGRFRNSFFPTMTEVYNQY